jgi:hypothetical protein
MARQGHLPDPAVGADFSEPVDDFAACRAEFFLGTDVSWALHINTFRACISLQENKILSESTQTIHHEAHEDHEGRAKKKNEPQGTQRRNAFFNK